MKTKTSTCRRRDKRKQRLIIRKMEEVTYDVDTSSTNVTDFVQQQQQQQQQQQLLNLNNSSGIITPTTATTTITPIYLRVKRRINVIPATSIRLEGLVRQQVQEQRQQTQQTQQTQQQSLVLSEKNNDIFTQSTNVPDNVMHTTYTASATTTTITNNNDTTIVHQRPAVWKLVQSTSTSLLNDFNTKAITTTVTTVTDTSSTDTATATNSKKRIVTAILNDNDDDNDDNNNKNSSNSNTKRKRRRLRLAIVNDTLTDACISSLLLFQQPVIENSNTATTTTNTEEETLTTTTTTVPKSPNSKIIRTSNKRVPLKILHPLERLINDSLQQVFVNSNNRTPIQHYEYIMNEFSTVASVSVTSVSSVLQYGFGCGVTSNNSTNYNNNNNTLQWLLWCNEEYGNIIHACAMWNDCTAASMVLEYCCNLFQNCIDNNNNIEEAHYRGTTNSNKKRNRAHIQQQQLVLQLKQMIDTKNSNQQTPYDVAKVLDHTNICDLIINYENTITTVPPPPSSTTIDDDNNNDNDTNQYEYDLYCLLPDLANNTKAIANVALPSDIVMNDNDNDTSHNIDNTMIHDNNNSSSSSNAITVKDIKNDDYHSDSEDDDGILCELGHGHVGYWNENGELVLEMKDGNNNKNIDIDDDNCINSTDTDDDDDSNRESYVGNDYPDYSDNDDNDEEYYYRNSNNNDEYDDDDNYYSNRNNDNNSDAGNSDYDHNDDNDIDGLYDPSYGIY